MRNVHKGSLDDCTQQRIRERIKKFHKFWLCQRSIKASSEEIENNSRIVKASDYDFVKFNLFEHKNYNFSKFKTGFLSDLYYDYHKNAGDHGATSTNLFPLPTNKSSLIIPDDCKEMYEADKGEDRNNGIKVPNCDNSNSITQSSKLYDTHNHGNNFLYKRKLPVDIIIESNRKHQKLTNNSCSTRFPTSTAVANLQNHRQTAFSTLICDQTITKLEERSLLLLLEDHILLLIVHYLGVDSYRPLCMTCRLLHHVLEGISASCFSSHINLSNSSFWFDILNSYSKPFHTTQIWKNNSSPNIKIAPPTTGTISAFQDQSTSIEYFLPQLSIIKGVGSTSISPCIVTQKSSTFPQLPQPWHLNFALKICKFDAVLLCCSAKLAYFLLKHSEITYKQWMENELLAGWIWFQHKILRRMTDSQFDRWKSSFTIKYFSCCLEDFPSDISIKNDLGRTLQLSEVLRKTGSFVAMKMSKKDHALFFSSVVKEIEFRCRMLAEKLIEQYQQLVSHVNNVVRNRFDLENILISLPLFSKNCFLAGHYKDKYCKSWLDCFEHNAKKIYTYYFPNKNPEHGMMNHNGFKEIPFAQHKDKKNFSVDFLHFLIRDSITFLDNLDDTWSDFVDWIDMTDELMESTECIDIDEEYDHEEFAPMKKRVDRRIDKINISDTDRLHRFHKDDDYGIIIERSGYDIFDDSIIEINLEKKQTHRNLKEKEIKFLPSRQNGDRQSQDYSYICLCRSRNSQSFSLKDAAKMLFRNFVLLDSRLMYTVCCSIYSIIQFLEKSLCINNVEKKDDAVKFEYLENELYDTREQTIDIQTNSHRGYELTDNPLLNNNEIQEKNSSTGYECSNLYINRAIDLFDRVLELTKDLEVCDNPHFMNRNSQEEFSLYISSPVKNTHRRLSHLIS